MGYLRHIIACNRHDPAGFRPLVVAGATVGSVRHALAERLAEFPAVFATTAEAVTLNPALGDFADRSAAVASVVDTLVAAGTLPPLKRETYPVLTRWGADPLFGLDRGAVPAFGVTAYGLHVNGHVCTASGPELWIGRRGRDRAVAPGKLDNLVAGGQPLGLTLAQNLVKEGREEADLPPELAARAIPVGAITYALDREDGLRRDVLFIFDLALSEDFVPRNTDGEVEQFCRWPLATVAARLLDTDDFKFNVNLVIIDFLIRHGFLTPDTPDYLDLVKGLRQ